MAQLEKLNHEEEKYILPNLIKYLSKLDMKSKAQTNQQIIVGMENIRVNEFACMYKNPMKTAEKLRKMLNYIRVNELLGIAGTVKGYWVPKYKEDLQEYNKEFRERIESQVAAWKGNNKVSEKLPSRPKNYNEQVDLWDIL